MERMLECFDYYFRLESCEYGGTVTAYGATWIENDFDVACGLEFIGTGSNRSRPNTGSVVVNKAFVN